jgi:hypothetical protein
LTSRESFSALHKLSNEKKNLKLVFLGATFLIFNLQLCCKKAAVMAMQKRIVRRGVSPPSSTLFSAPAPSQSRSRLYSHAHSQPLLHIRGRSQSRSKSPWTEESGEETEDTTSISSYQSRSRSRSASTVDYGLEHDKIREPSHRRLHLQKVFDLLHLSIARKDGVRAFRCLRILLKSHEWRPIELWRYALEVATITSLHVNEDDNIEDSADVIPLTKREQVARKRLAFLRELSKARTGLVSAFVCL